MIFGIIQMKTHILEIFKIYVYGIIEKQSTCVRNVTKYTNGSNGNNRVKITQSEKVIDIHIMNKNSILFHVG